MKASEKRMILITSIAAESWMLIESRQGLKSAAQQKVTGTSSAKNMNRRAMTLPVYGPVICRMIPFPGAAKRRLTERSRKQTVLGAAIGMVTVGLSNSV